jgi:hypothetical protein
MNAFMQRTKKERKYEVPGYETTLLARRCRRLRYEKIRNLFAIVPIISHFGDTSIQMVAADEKNNKGNVV